MAFGRNIDYVHLGNNFYFYKSFIATWIVASQYLFFAVCAGLFGYADYKSPEVVVP